MNFLKHTINIKGILSTQTFVLIENKNALNKQTFRRKKNSHYETLADLRLGFRPLQPYNVQRELSIGSLSIP